MPLTPSQKDALIRFAEEHGDFLDTLLSGDRDEYSQIAEDFETIQRIDSGYYGKQTEENLFLYRTEVRRFDACAALRKTLKQTVEA